MKHTGPVNTATTYFPPSRPYLPIPVFHQLASNTTPIYIFGDLNAKHKSLGDNYNYTVGKGIYLLLENYKLNHLQPDFPTFISHNTHTTPGIILSNNKTYHNYKPGAGLIISDHIPIILTLTIQAIKKPTPLKLNYKKNRKNSMKTFRIRYIQLRQRIEQCNRTSIMCYKNGITQYPRQWRNIPPKQKQKQYRNLYPIQQQKQSNGT